MNRWKYVVLSIGLFIGISEVGVRTAGLGNFPIYQTDSEIGYIPAPSQSGKFLNKNDWCYNDKSMGVSENYEPSEKMDLLLLGDSLVQGGNPYRQVEKLGPQLQGLLGEEYRVWPIGAPSWGFLNEKEYLDRHPEVMPGLDGLIWVFNSGDFQDRSKWWTDATHPRSRPLLLSYYVLNKYVFEGNLKVKYPSLLFWVKSPAQNSLKRMDEEFDGLSNELQALQSHPLKYKIIVFYPDKGEFSNHENPFYDFLSSRIQAQAEENGWKFIDIRTLPEWKSEYYRDQIHPTPQGYSILSKKIKELVEEISSAN
ncbi:MAG: hypothetical protein V4507_07140 [Verrucomicrobiota bacterium]